MIPQHTMPEASSTSITSASSNPTTDSEALGVGRTRRKSRKRSKAWSHYIAEQQSDGTEKVVCKYCGHSLTHTTNSGTTHLLRHLKHGCKSAPRELSEYLSEHSPHSEGGRVFHFDQEISRNCLAKLLVCAELPFKIVEHPAFITFVKSLQSLFVMPGRQTIRNDCILLYQEEKRRLHESLKALDCRVSFTIDMWTSNQKLGYFVLTAHYIDNAFVLHKKILSFKKASYPHTSNVLLDIFVNCLREWQFEDRIFALTMDNCSTNNYLAKLVKQHFSAKLVLHGDHLHIQCCAHILNILVQDRMKVMDESIKRIRSLIVYIVSSPSRMQTFNVMARFFKLPARNGLMLDVPTRWNSTYAMLNDALSYKDAFVKYSEEHFRNEAAPIADDWKKAELVAKFLKTFYDATEVFSGSKYPTANLYLREVVAIRSVLEEGALSNEEVLKTLALEMQKKYEKYWNKFNKILLIAAVLDPRLKLAYIEYIYFKECDNVEVCKTKIRELRDLLNDIYAQYERTTQRDDNVVNTFYGSANTCVDVGIRRADMELAAFWSQISLKRAKRNEVDSYLEDDLLYPKPNSDFNVLEWWKSNAPSYPILSTLARDILAIPVSTVPSESSFSTGGRVVDQYHSRLSPPTIEALICTQDWLREEYNKDAPKDSCILDADLSHECLM